MSECPNCDAAIIEIRWPSGGSWICGSTKTEQDAPARQSWACKRIAEQQSLIRSLREELADVRGLAISMAHELKCSYTHMDCDGECANADCGSCYPCKLHVQAKALRNNEHRGNG